MSSEQNNDTIAPESLVKKKTLSLGGKLSIKPSISKITTGHSGRGQSITVEVKRKRGADRPAEDIESFSNDPNLPEHLRKLTDYEVDARLRAVKQAMEAQAIAERHKAESINTSNQNDLDSVPQNDDVVDGVVDASNESDSTVPSNEINPIDLAAIDFEDPLGLKQNKSKVAEKHNFKTINKAEQSESSDTPGARKSVIYRADSPAKKVITAPAKKEHIAAPRKLDRTTLTRVLNDEAEQKTRSLAAMRRLNQKKVRQMHGDQRAESQKIIREVIIPESIVVSELANRMAIRSSDVVKSLMKLGMIVTINQIIDADTAELICSEFGHTAKRVAADDVEIGLKGPKDDPLHLQSRAPVVTIMGHVDHGKTSLLDALRKTDVVSGEAGGITQHIGAYQVTLPSKQKITFIDTPGHAAFSEMRARGANVTDIVVLVVAADDGIMEQTIEAINHAKAANVPIVVAINKIDKPDSNSSKIKNDLLNHGLVLEDFGGDVLSIEVSARTGFNLQKLEEAILLQAELINPQANPNRAASGAVIEAKIDKGRGTLVTLLVQNGTLRVGDIIVAGSQWGKVRAMVSDHGSTIKEAGPSLPVEVMGFGGAPMAGDEFLIVESEAKAREIAESRSQRKKYLIAKSTIRSSMETLMSQIAAGEAKELPVIIKTDVQGSLEAITTTMLKLKNDEVNPRILHGGVGAINESDITLARASGGLVLGFNVRANPQARELSRRDSVDIRYYSIIYDLINDIKVILSGMLAPTLKERFLGNAQIRDVFNITGVGKVAGCMITDGIVKRGAKVRLLRDNVVIHEGTLKTLKRFKDEVKEVKESFECGMAFENYNDIRVLDVIECFEIESIARVL